jgi:hypothetical protein
MQPYLQLFFCVTMKLKGKRETMSDNQLVKQHGIIHANRENNNKIVPPHCHLHELYRNDAQKYLTLQEEVRARQQRAISVSKCHVNELMTTVEPLEYFDLRNNKS